MEGYFESEGFPKKQYHINEYLSQYYAMVREKVTFKIMVSLRDDEEINDCLRFKIKYSDLIGNEYEQKFEFAYMPFKGHFAYSMDNSSYKPILLKGKTFGDDRK